MTQKPRTDIVDYAAMVKWYGDNLPALGFTDEMTEEDRAANEALAAEAGKKIFEYRGTIDGQFVSVSIVEGNSGVEIIIIVA